MKKTAWVIFGLTLAATITPSYGIDRKGLLGLNYTVGPSFIMGGDDASETSSVEPGVGAALGYGLTNNVEVQFAYDYIDASLRTQALTFVGLWHFSPGQSWEPFAGAGLGWGKPYSGKSWGHFALKLTGGLEKWLTTEVSLAGVLSYHYVEGPDPFGSVHALEPGVRLNYYFGNLNR